VGERQARIAEDILREAGYSDVKIDVEGYDVGKDPHLGPGSGIVVYAETGSGAIIGSDALGEKGKPAERVGSEAAENLLSEIRSGMPVDKHMADMLIPYMAVAKGQSRILTSEITLHTLTNIRITELIAEVKFTVNGEMGKPGSIQVDGIGLAL
jgi:RNA 3'-terminal phosphate cyclase (ATP)